MNTEINIEDLRTEFKYRLKQLILDYNEDDEGFHIKYDDLCDETLQALGFEAKYPEKIARWCA